MGKDDLLKTLDISFKELLASSQGLEEDKATMSWCGNWSVKEILAHITGWNKEMTSVLKRLQRGEKATPDGKDYSDTEYWNSRFTADYQGIAYDAIVEEWKSSQQALNEAAKTLPAERFCNGRSGYRIIHNAGIVHNNEHSQEIRAWRRQQGGI